jgi:protocatechuate 3,4-dioxygenase, alpha subunit
MDLTPTPSQTVGPYFHLGCTDPHSISRVVTPNGNGQHIRLFCRVLDGDGVPIDDSMIELWQADSEGKYSHSIAPGNQPDPNFNGFGRLATDANGECVFETIKPGRVPARNGLQAPHINLSVFARGVMQRLATRVYFADDPANTQCPVLALVPEQRRATLMAHQSPHDSGDWYYVIRLCGKDETVFFDV